MTEETQLLRQRSKKNLKTSRLSQTWRSTAVMLGSSGMILKVTSTVSQLLCEVQYLTDNILYSQVLNSYLYWDNRATKTVPYAENFEAVDGACRDQAATHYAWVVPYMSSSETTNGQTTVLTMCQNYVAQWVQSYEGGTETMTAWAKKVWTPKDQIDLDDFQIKTMSTALMHEFTHAPAIVGADYLRTCAYDRMSGMYPDANSSVQLTNLVSWTMYQ
jgi:hypothetical protein